MDSPRLPPVTQPPAGSPVPAAATEAIRASGDVIAAIAAARTRGRHRSIPSQRGAAIRHRGQHRSVPCHAAQPPAPAAGASPSIPTPRCASNDHRRTRMGAGAHRWQVLLLRHPRHQKSKPHLRGYQLGFCGWATPRRHYYAEWKTRRPGGTQGASTDGSVHLGGFEIVAVPNLPYPSTPCDGAPPLSCRLRSRVSSSRPPAV